MLILHRMDAALNLEDALQTALAKVAELFELHTGWIFLQLQDTGDF